MSLFVVRMFHPEGDGWDAHVVEHVRYLKEQITRGRLLASGPLKGTPLRAGFLLVKSDSYAEVQAMIDADPFAREGLICDLTIEEWDPLFGQLTDHASGELPPSLAELD